MIELVLGVDVTMNFDKYVYDDDDDDDDDDDLWMPGGLKDFPPSPSEGGLEGGLHHHNNPYKVGIDTMILIVLS